jgi:hypothetical protein
VSSGEGYVPQVTVVGVNQSVLCCTASAVGALGQLPFQTYLLNWTAAKERTGEEGASGEDAFVDLTAAEKDAIYRKACVYFDDQLEGVDQTNKDTCLLARAKQYIYNEATHEEGNFRMSTAGRARASTMKKEIKKAGGLAKLQGAQMAAGAERESFSAQLASTTKITGAVLAVKPPAPAQSDADWEAKQVAAKQAAAGVTDISEMVFESPSDESGLEAMAGRSGRAESVSDNVDYGGVYK